MDRRAELERALEVLWMALDGQRLIESAKTDDAGVPYTYREASAPLVREVRAVTAELAALPRVEGKVSKADEITARRQARRGNVDSAPAARRGQQRRSNGSHRAR